MELPRRRLSGTIRPYLRYRKWKGKDDNEEEERNRLEGYCGYVRDSARSARVRMLPVQDPLPDQKLLITQTLASELAPKMARCRLSGDGNPHVRAD